MQSQTLSRNWSQDEIKLLNKFSSCNIYINYTTSCTSITTHGHVCWLVYKLRHTHNTYSSYTMHTHYRYLHPIPARNKLKQEGQFGSDDQVCTWMVKMNFLLLIINEYTRALKRTSQLVFISTQSPKWFYGSEILQRSSSSVPIQYVSEANAV